jgi:hypothetical protein
MRGRDKAPPRSKAEAKADRYQPIIKAVDDWYPPHASRLTKFREFAACKRPRRGKIRIP